MIILHHASITLEIRPFFIISEKMLKLPVNSAVFHQIGLPSNTATPLDVRIELICFLSCIHR